MSSILSLPEALHVLLQQNSSFKGPNIPTEFTENTTYIPLPASDSQDNMTSTSKMPSPLSPNAPRFDRQRVNDFIDITTLLLDQALVTNETERIKFLIRYASDRVRDVIEYETEFDPDNDTRTYAAACDKLRELYGVFDKPPERTLTDLENFCKASRQKEFTRVLDIDEYHENFLAIASVLKKNAICTQLVLNQYFVAGIPATIHQWFIATLPAENRVKTNPPSISQSVTLLKTRYEPTALLNLPWDQESKPVTYDKQGQRVGAQASIPKVNLNAQMPLTNVRLPASDEDVNNLTERLRSLTISQITAAVQASPGLVALLPLILSSINGQSQPVAANYNQQNSQPQRSLTGRCFMCGQSDAHPLSLSACPETSQLVEARKIRYDVETRKYVLMDGSQLPQLPRNYPGGVAAAIKGSSTGANSTPIRDLPPHMTARVTNHIGLSDGSNEVLGRGVFAIESFHSAAPITRSGRDTEV